VSFVSTAAYNVNLNGTTVGSAYDELNVTGTVTIDPSSTLDVTLGAGFTPAVGNTFVIIQSSNAISGTFASLPEGAIYVAGGHSFQVSYKNNDVILMSVAATTTTVSSSLNPSNFGQSVTFTATVAPGTGTFDNGGTVQFAIDGTNYGSPVSLSGGSATISDSALAASGTAHTVTAAYSGDTGFASSTGTLSGGQTVLPIHPVVTDILVEWGNNNETMSILNLSRDLPFADITGFQVKFSESVNITGTGLSLTSTAGGPTYAAPTLVSGQSTNDVSWHLPTAIGIDRLMLALDQADITATADSSLTLVGTSTLAFSVLPGDFKNDGVVSAAAMTGVNNEIGQAYDVWADLNGTGTVDFSDVQFARSKIGTKLPLPPS